MRKRIIQQDTAGPAVENQRWLDLESLVQVDLTSEDAAHPIESAMKAGVGPGWRAQEPGKQTTRLISDTPHRVSRIQVMFQDDQRERTQEFALRWSPDGGHRAGK